MILTFSLPRCWTRRWSMRRRTIDLNDDHDQKVGAPAFLWWIVGMMALIEFTLSAADTGVIGTPEWRWITFTYGAFWQPLLSNDVGPVFSGHVFTMFITYAFLHGGIAHLLLNSVVLLALGKMVAGSVGAIKTTIILLLSAIGGAVAFGMISTSSAPMVGASGAVFGLIGVWQAWDYLLRKQSNLPMTPVLSSVLAIAVANVLLAFVMSGGLAWEAHLGGWLIGVAAALTFARPLGTFAG